MAVSRQISYGLDPEVAWIFTQFSFYLIEGFVTFGETHHRRADDIAHALELLGRIREALPEIQQGLQWARPETTEP